MDLMEKIEKIGFVPTWIPLNFENDPKICLDTKSIKDPDFPIYLLLAILKKNHLCLG